MKKPIRLFGVEDKQQPCYFIHNQGLGYWFIALKQRTVGEASTLAPIVSKIERLEIDNNLLILDICTENKEELIKEFLAENKEGLTEEDKAQYLKELETKTFTPELNLLIENYTRNLLSTGDIQHPTLYKYRDRIVTRLNTSIMFQYQIEVVKCALKHRLITEEKHIVKHDTDDERGYILADDIAKYKFIGEIDPDISELGELLTLQIYQFVTNDFAGKDWETTKQKARQADEQSKLLAAQTTDDIEKEFAEFVVEPDDEVTEKKHLVSTSLNELNNQSLMTGMTST
jgi:hypothetical protein